MPRVKFTKEDILKATYEIMKQEGIKCVSARKIASKFKGSTAPIYANFKTIDELKNSVIEIAEEKLKEYLYRDYLGREILDAAVGFIKFARDEKELFRAIFLDASDGFENLFNETMEFLLKKEILFKSFPKLSYDEGKETIDKLWIYLFGYATLVFINPNSQNEESDEIISEKITDMANYFREIYEMRKIINNK